MFATESKVHISLDFANWGDQYGIQLTLVWIKVIELNWTIHFHHERNFRPLLHTSEKKNRLLAARLSFCFDIACILVHKWTRGGPHAGLEGIVNFCWPLNRNVFKRKQENSNISILQMHSQVQSLKFFIAFVWPWARYVHVPVASL